MAEWIPEHYMIPIFRALGIRDKLKKRMNTTVSARGCGTEIVPGCLRQRSTQ
jgi:hypothetical protein